MMKKLLILSGKGGTGKTTTACAFIKFSNAQAIADCDVDAPNLHIVADTKGCGTSSPFYGSEKSCIDEDKCTGCKKCLNSCRFGAISEKDGKCFINEFACEGCSVCEAVCPVGAVSLKTDQAGTLTLFKDEKTFSTAKLKMGRGNSGKLVTEVKNAMSRNALQAELAIIDGSPGIGCPVIASVTGVTMVLIVAEPSISGLSDLKRILKTAGILDVPVAVCVNKFDISPSISDEIIRLCHDEGIPFTGKIPYDKTASEAINQGKSLADFSCNARDALFNVYQNTIEILQNI